MDVMAASSQSFAEGQAQGARGLEIQVLAGARAGNNRLMDLLSAAAVDSDPMAAELQPASDSIAVGHAMAFSGLSRSSSMPDGGQQANSSPLPQLQLNGRGARASQGPQRYKHYHMQRLQTTANHVLFYLVDSTYEAKLAIVGTDVRLSGHFVYCTLPLLEEGPPIRCTNRVKVMEWLASHGARDPVDPERVRVPSISREQLELLLTSDPMFSKPKMERDYTTWREEGGRLPDGRHYKNFLLVDEKSGEEKLVITAEDSHRRDRRYNYKAVPEMGGFAFENGQAVKEWLDFVVGRPPAPHQPRPLPARAAARAAAVVAATGMPPGAVLEPQPMPMAPSRSMPASAGAPPQQRMARQVFPFGNGQDAHAQQGQVMYGGSVGSVLAAISAGSLGHGHPQQQAGGMDPSMLQHMGGHGGQPERSPRTMGLAPGPFSYASDPQLDLGQRDTRGRAFEPLSAGAIQDSLAAARAAAGAGQLSPDLFYSWNEHDLGAAAEAAAAAAMGGARPMGGGPPSAATLPSPPMRPQPSGAGAAAAGGAGNSDVCMMDMSEEGEEEGPASGGPGSSPDSGADVVQAFADDATLLHWVTSVPDQATLAQFEAWGSALQAAANQAAQLSPVPPLPATTRDAATILKMLETQPVCLRLLEGTQVSVAVAALRTYPDATVAHLANMITNTWRSTAAAALTRATSAMQAAPGPVIAVSSPTPGMACGPMAASGHMATDMQAAAAAACAVAGDAAAAAAAALAQQQGQLPVRRAGLVLQL